MKQVLPAKWQDQLRRAQALAQRAVQKTREAEAHKDVVEEFEDGVEQSRLAGGPPRSPNAPAAPDSDYYAYKAAFEAILSREEAAGNASKTLFGNVSGSALLAASVGRDGSVPTVQGPRPPRLGRMSADIRAGLGLLGRGGPQHVAVDRLRHVRGPALRVALPASPTPPACAVLVWKRRWRRASRRWRGRSGRRRYGS